MQRFLPVLFLTLSQQGGALDVDRVLEKADKLLEEAKASYEGAREKSAIDGFVEAGFKLEEARIKYLVLQEIGGPEKQKVAGDRLRSVNQLAKLIHDGKVAVSGAAVGEPAPKSPGSATPDPPKPDSTAEPKRENPNPPAPKAPDVQVRLAVPDQAKQKESEKLLREVYKDQYAKKAPADRQVLARLLLQQSKEAASDPSALWVMLREAQEIAIQTCDVPTIIAAIDGAAACFDVDGLALKNASLSAAGKYAKVPEEFGALTRALLQLVEEFVAADQYDLADKATSMALQLAKKANDGALSLRVSSRVREIAEAKTRFQGMKGALETLARNPEDPGANGEMGQLLCFVKGNWDLGLRFLVKGADPTLKSLAEKELALSLQPADQAAVGDGWWDLAEKEKSPLRKSQMQSHARAIYESALPGLTALQKIKVEKRLETGDPVALTQGAINLMKLIDLSKDVVKGDWKLQGDQLISDNAQAARVEIPYEPPAEYDLKVTFTRNDGQGDVFFALTKNNRSFEWGMGVNANTCFGFGIYRGQWVGDAGCQGAAFVPNGLSNGKVHVSLVQVRKDDLKGFLDGKLIKELKDPYADLAPHSMLRLRNDSILGVGSYQSSTSFLKIELVEITGKGKKSR